MPARRGVRAVQLVGGFLLGLLVFGLALWYYLRVAQVGQLGGLVAERVKLPPQAFTLERVGPGGRMRIVLRDVALLGERGDTIAAAPRLALLLDPGSLSGDGPVVFSQAVLEEPYVHLVQTPSGEWNIFQRLTLQAGGQAVAADTGRAVVFRDVRIRNGRAVVALPSAPPPDTAAFAARLQLPRERLGGAAYEVYRFRGVDARLPMLRLGGGSGWRVQVGTLNARLARPDLPLRVAGATLQAEGAAGVRFQLASLRVGDSQLSGRGLIDFGGATAAYDLTLHADPLRFADLQPLLPSLPDQGRAAFALAVKTGAAGRTSLAFSDLTLDAAGSHLAGSLTLLAGGGAPLAFGETRLELAPLRLATLAELGVVDSLPLLGEVTGTLSSPAGGGGALTLGVTARLVPPGAPDATPSVVAASGELALGEAGAPFRLRDVRLEL